MSVKLGNADISFWLGTVEPIKVCLGSQEVWTAPPPPYYFIGQASDANWNTLANWYRTPTFTQFGQATELPGPSDNVVILAEVYFNSGSAPTVANLTAPDAPGTRYIGITMTVTGLATFGTNAIWSGPGGPVLTGNAVFNGGGVAITTAGSPSVTGNVTFNGTRIHLGTVTGNATFNDSSENRGTVTGDATFTGSACNSGTVNGSITGSPASCP
jgi:hypothetical protein